MVLCPESIDYNTFVASNQGLVSVSRRTEQSEGKGASCFEFGHDELGFVPSTTTDTMSRRPRRRSDKLQILLYISSLLMLYSSAMPGTVLAFRATSPISSNKAPLLTGSFSSSLSLRTIFSSTTILQAVKPPNKGDQNNNSSNNNNHRGNSDKRNNHKGRKDQSQRRRQQQSRRRTTINGTAQNATESGVLNGAAAANGVSPPLDSEKRISQLEDLVARQAVEIKRLKDECKSLSEAVETFASVVELLREAGLSKESIRKEVTNEGVDFDEDDDDGDDEADKNGSIRASSTKKESSSQPTYVESLEDDDEIFGKAPSSVMDAADAAGAAVLAGLLAGQRRLLVDVRDAELVDPEILVQFLELAILPVAAGLEGLRSRRNRLKIVFPKVSQLLEYRKTMALAAPEVVALSTMDFDPIESHDNLVVVLAPHPDDAEGVQAMRTLLDPKSGITQPVVVLNPYMAPITGPAADFTVAYQLRLYTVHYMARPPPLDKGGEKDSQNKTKDQLEAAMQHAKEVSRNPTEHGGTTRAMVIRAYPNPWNVFVDISPDTDADFVVAATFAEEPTAEDVNKAIIECLEGSEEEDELVAQQMQQALESGQLDRVSELLGSMGLDIFDDDEDEEDDDDDEDDLWRLQDVDTV